MANYSKNRRSSKPQQPPKTWAEHKFLAYPPNDQQTAILEAVRTRKSGKVLALAGTGKTTLLRQVAEDPANRELKFLYLAFNRSVADAADAAFPPNVKAINPHRLAYRAMASEASRRNGKYPSAEHVATVLNARPFTYQSEGGEVTVDTGQIGTAIKEAVGNFCNSSDRHVTAWHLKRTPQAKRIPEAHRERFLAHVLPYVERAWADIANPHGSLPYMPGRGDSCYLKLWSLSNPKLFGYDVILYDESQDANPPTAHVVEIQKCQKVYVGDSNQAIYGFTGAVDALSKFEAEWTCPLTKSYRFGPAIAEAGNSVLRHVPDNDLVLEGHDPIESVVDDLEDPDCILCRTNAGLIENALTMVAQGLNVAIAGGTADIEYFAKQAEILSDPDAAIERNEGKLPKLSHPQLVPFKQGGWEAVKAAVEEGDASDMAMMVRLIDNYGADVILKVCENSSNLRRGVDPTEWAHKPGNVMLSTAHKAKGLEWNRVKIGSDFQPPKAGKKLQVAELMLIYVAVTRAKLHLDKSNLAWLDTLADEMLSQDENGRLGAI